MTAKITSEFPNTVANENRIKKINKLMRSFGNLSRYSVKFGSVVDVGGVVQQFDKKFIKLESLNISIGRSPVALSVEPLFNIINW